MIKSPYEFGNEKEDELRELVKTITDEIDLEVCTNIMKSLTTMTEVLENLVNDVKKIKDSLEL